MKKVMAFLVVLSMAFGLVLVETDPIGGTTTSVVDPGGGR